jgi:hypothetical protein
MKIVINPSWKCQLQCTYCWLPHTKINREAVEHPWHEWAEALIRILPKGSIVDVCGGEPLLYEGIERLLKQLGDNGIHWAVTTNALASEGVERLIKIKPERCVVINISDHRGNLEARSNIDRLRGIFPTVIHRLIHPAAGMHERQACGITYQPWKEGEALDGKRRRCNAGVQHCVTDPSGDAWRCVVDMQVGNEPFGNIFEENFHFLRGDFMCDFGCSTAYTQAPGEWMVAQRIEEEGRGNPART